MARPKRIPEKAPVKRTRRAKIDPTSPEHAKVPEAWIDEQLRKECIQMAANYGSTISSLVKDAEALYSFIKGATYSTSVTYSQPVPQSTDPIMMYDHPEEATPEPLPRISKLDAHTL